MHSVTLQMRERVIQMFIMHTYFVQCLCCATAAKLLSVSKRTIRRKMVFASMNKVKVELFSFTFSFGWFSFVYSRVMVSVCVWLPTVPIQLNSILKFPWSSSCFVFTSLNNSLRRPRVLLLLYARILFDFYLGL